MVRIGQIGIALGALGIVLTVMGLFPGVTGVTPTPGIGAIQLVIVLSGFSLLIMGAFIYAKYTFYPHSPANLAQQIAIRLSMTALLFAGMAAMADVLGFGSNVRTEESDIFFGPWQAGGLIGGFLIAALGVLLYAVTGPADNGRQSPPAASESKPEAEPGPATTEDENSEQPSQPQLTL
jgi:hypothetical protein